MDTIEPSPAERTRVIRYGDEEATIMSPGEGPSNIVLPPIQRTKSTSSMSIKSMHSLNRRNPIDPAIALPIQYRSVSFDLEEGKHRQQEELGKNRNAVAIELSNVDYHTVSVVELEKKFSTVTSEGLTAAEVQSRVAQYGKNQMSPVPTQWFSKIFGYFFKGFGSILLIGCILVFVSWQPLGQPPAIANLALAIVLLAVFLIQAAFNAWQDWSSSRVMASITAMLPEDTLVLREGVVTTVTAVGLVPGDIVYLKAGNKLPADVRFVEVSADASFDRSILTGESLPVNGTVDSTDENYLETRCIGLQGTHCTTGTATGIVVSTGDNTVFGKIAKMSGESSTELTTLEKEVLRFVLIIFVLMLTMIVVVIIVWAAYLRTNQPGWINVPTLIVDCVSVAIAFIPEGLPIALTASLTITANIMSKNKILCKSLKAVETLGAVSVICSDKTGTLTKNKMFVTDCAIATKTFTPESARDDMVENKSISAIPQLRAMTGLCNAGEFDAAAMNLPLHERRTHGDATDQAVLRFSEGLGSVSALRQMFRKTYDLAFNSKNKFMLRIFSPQTNDGLDLALSVAERQHFQPEDCLLTIKGAPDILIKRCTQWVNPSGEVEELTSDRLEGVKALKDQWSSEGKRVILMTRKILKAKDIMASPSNRDFESEALRHAQTDLILVGMVGIVDPPRDEIPEVVSTLRRAGIRFFMVTGDFGLTALAIARQCGIVTTDARVHDIKDLIRYAPTTVTVASSESDSEKNIPIRFPKAIVLSGPDLMTLSDYQWEQLCKYQEIVFSRTTPDQKLRIVREFQARDEIVAMTGDGVNDAPSLKAADMGIAMGGGSDIAIEAADMVLLDSFSAIVEAVKYGRVVFDNLKKTITYLLPAGSFSEFWPVFTNVIFGLPQVLSSFLMIIICCFTDCAAATVIALEKPEADVLLRPPRNPKKDRLVNWKLILQAYGFIGVIETVLSFAMSYWYLQRNGVPFNVLWFGYGNQPADMDTDTYNNYLNEASSVYFVNLVVMQWFSLMAIRTRRLSIFQHPPAWNKATQNLWLFPAIAFALVIAIFWLYVPAFQDALGTSPIPAVHWFLPMAFGIGLLCLDEGRKAAVRRWPSGFLARIAW